MEKANSASSTSGILYYDPRRTDFTLNEEELSRIKAASQNYWKDFCLVSISVGLPTIINACEGTKDPFELTLPLFLNYLFGVLGLILFFIFLILWKKTRKDLNIIIDEIKSKPKYLVTVSSTSAETQVINLEASPEEVNNDS